MYQPQGLEKKKSVVKKVGTSEENVLRGTHFLNDDFFSTQAPVIRVSYEP